MYRTIDASFWTDPKVRKLTIQDRYFLLYLITNPHGHVAGIYYLPLVTQRYETGISDRVLHGVWDRVSALGIAHFDPETEVVFVRNMFKYQGQGEKHQRSAANQLKTLHNSPLVKWFLKLYPAVSVFLPDEFAYPIDTPSEFGTQRRTGEEQEQEKEKNRIAKKVFGPNGLVRLTEEEYVKLLSEFGEQGTEERIVAADLYIGSTGKKYASHYLTILNWERKNGTRQHANESTGEKHPARRFERPYVPKQ